MPMKLFRQLKPPGQSTKARPVSLDLGVHRNAVRQDLPRRELIQRSIIYTALVALTILAFPGTETFEIGARVQVGDIWLRDDVIAPLSFPVLKSDEVFQAEIDSIRHTEPPVFREVQDAYTITQARLDTLDVQLGVLFQSYADWQDGLVREDSEAAEADSLRYVQLRNTIDLELSSNEWNILLTSYISRAGTITPARPLQSGPPLHDVLISEVSRISTDMLSLGILDISRDSVLTPQVAVVNQQERTEILLPTRDVYGWDQAWMNVRNNLDTRFASSRDTVGIGLAFLARVLQPSLVYMPDETEARYRDREQRVTRVTGLVQEGEAIVRRGDVVTPEIHRRLESLAHVRVEQQGGFRPVSFFIGKLLLTCLTFAMFFLFLYLLRRQVYDSTANILLLCILFAMTVSFFGVIARLPLSAAFAVPVALAPILITVLFDSRIGLISAVTLAGIGGLIFGYDFEFIFATIVAGLTAVLSLRNITMRSQIFLTAGLVLLVYALIFAGFALMRPIGLGRLLQDLMFVGINASLLVLAYPFLWIFEKGFGISTDLTLIEYQNANNPVLRELSNKASGTFAHSNQVANMAEAAAIAIGANSTLARVGALYHDIGKMRMPQYFVENHSKEEVNPHETQSPSMSATIIRRHVPEGVEIAQQARLPKAIIDFIRTHHGTSVMSFFHHKAKDLAKEKGGEVLESDFRYPGPKPWTKEQGIVMLADAIEAASKSLTHKTRKNIERLIDDLVRKILEDGQLDKTPLRYSDLQPIKETFLQTLLGAYGERIRYPDQVAENTSTTTMDL